MNKKPTSPRSTGNRIKSLVVYVVIPYAIGYLFSHGYLSDWYKEYLSGNSPSRQRRSMLLSTSSPWNQNALNEQQQAAPPSLAPQQCDVLFRKLLNFAGDQILAFMETFASVSFVLHRNGEPTMCGTVDSGEVFLQQLKTNYERLGGGVCLAELNKYQVESLLTITFHEVLANSQCHSVESYGKISDGFLGFCDNGKDHTPILLDHDDLVPVSKGGDDETDNSSSLPCRFHTREGLRILKLEDLTQMAKTRCGNEKNSASCYQTTENNRKEIHLYAVPAGTFHENAQKPLLDPRSMADCFCSFLTFCIVFEHVFIPTIPNRPSIYVRTP